MTYGRHCRRIWLGVLVVALGACDGDDDGSGTMTTSSTTSPSTSTTTTATTGASGAATRGAAPATVGTTGLLDACQLTGGCAAGMFCVAPFDGDYRQAFECVAQCVELLDNARWCADTAACCDPTATCSPRGFCEPPGDTGGTSAGSGTGG